MERTPFEAIAWAERMRTDAASVLVEFHSGPRAVVVTLDAFGGVLAREHGGPVCSFGQRVNVPSSTVAAWRSTRTPELHARILAALGEIAFPDTPMVPLYPDERPSSFTLRHRSGTSATIDAPGRLLASRPALRQVAAELDRICYETQVTPATERIPNPDLDLWR